MMSQFNVWIDTIYREDNISKVVEWNHNSIEIIRIVVSIEYYWICIVIQWECDYNN